MQFTFVDDFNNDNYMKIKVYKGVVPEFSDHVLQLCSGMSVAMEVRAERAVEVFRQTGMQSATILQCYIHSVSPSDDFANFLLHYKMNIMQLK